MCFFKQKTAYEMRISDWSSDVCSSDLDWAGNYQSLASGFRAKDRHPMLRIDPFNLILANNLMQNVINFTVWFALVFWAFLETQIGRASCRERVCQYV